MNNKNITITVVIPAYQSGPYLVELVEALLVQTFQPLEIIVSHSDSHNPTKLLACYAPLVKVIHSEAKLYAGAARNRGGVQAKGDWIAFFDEDVIPSKDCLEQFVSSTKKYPQRVLFAGSYDYATSGGYWGKSLWYIELGSQHFYLNEKEVATMGGGNNFVRKFAFDAVEGFNEGMLIGEDANFQLKIKEKFNALIFSPKAVGLHHNVGGFKYFIKHLIPLGKGAAAVRKRLNADNLVLVKYPLLALFLPFARIGLLLKRSMVIRNPRKLQLFLLLPGIFLGLIVWSSAFMKEAFKKNGK
jgi:glycosyltransferase involved in cell wall biosynthesis